MSLVLAIIVAGMPTAVARTDMPHASATTTVGSDNSCSIGGYAPGNETSYHLGSNPDTVRYSEDVEWDDNRDAHATPTATHYYYMWTQHNGNTQSTDKTVYTNGATSGSDTIFLDITNVYDGDTIRVILYTSLSGPTGSNCPAADQADINYTFVYP